MAAEDGVGQDVDGSASSLPTKEKALVPDPSLEVSASGVARRVSSETPQTTRTKSMPRSKTRYHLAHPAPIARQLARGQKQPRLVLQLQTTNGRRPLPAFDIVPASAFPHRAMRASSTIEKLKGTPSLGASDLIVLHGEDYQCFEDAAGLTSLPQERGWTARDMIGVIVKNEEGDDWQIDLEDGTSFDAKKLSKDQYELTSRTDAGESLRALWTARRPRPKPKETGVLSNALHSDRKLVFSPIQPGASWRPFVACATPTQIKVFDSYKTRLQGMN